MPQPTLVRPSLRRRSLGRVFLVAPGASHTQPLVVTYLLGPFTFDVDLGGLLSPYTEPVVIPYRLGPFTFDAALDGLLSPYTEPVVIPYLLGPFTFDAAHSAPLSSPYTE
jgi:hypothetical protein